MSYLQLSIDVAEEQAAMLAAALEGFAAPAPQSVTARRMGKGLAWRVEAIFDGSPDEAALAEFLGVALNSMCFARLRAEHPERQSQVALGPRDKPEDGGAYDLPFTLKPLPEEDWLAMSQAALPPIRTQRFYVRQPHLPLPEDLGARHVLTIEAGMAFGTGHHATTKGCLLALEDTGLRSSPAGGRGVRVADGGGSHARGAPPFGRLSGHSPRERGEKRIERVLDLGTGTGLLAIAAAKLWPLARITASDIDPVAIAVARENCRLNGAPAIRCVTAPGFHHSELAPKFDLILANILAGPLKCLARDMAAHARKGAHVVLSGILDGQVGEVLGVYRAVGFRRVRRRDLEGWAVLALVRV